MKEKVNIYWMRRDLRFEDNAALYNALMDELPIIPIFIFDKNILDELKKPYDKRVQFIYQELTKLNQYLFENYHSGIITFYDKPKNVFEKLLEKYDIQKVFVNRDYEPYAIQRDTEIKKFLKEKSVEYFSFKDHLIFEPWEIKNKYGKIFHIYTHFANAWKKLFNEESLIIYHSEKYLNKLYRFNKPLSIVPYESMGFKWEQDVEYRALNLSSEVLSNYHLTRDRIDNEKGTTNAGLYLRFGTISTRHLVKLGLQYNQQYLNELIWREFFQHLIYHYPFTKDENFREIYKQFNWENDKQLFEKWKKGETGFPIIDAAMRELNTTGYMHNRCRMIVANFLTKILLIDWRWGERYFAEKLMDYELASNVGNWQWCAGTGVDAAPYFRIFNPSLQQEKFDPSYKYVKKWIPDFGVNKYIQPIVNYEERRKMSLERYKSLIKMKGSNN